MPDAQQNPQTTNTPGDRRAEPRVATLLVSDLVDSTALVSQLGDVKAAELYLADICSSTFLYTAEETAYANIVGANWTPGAWMAITGHGILIGCR